MFLCLGTQLRWLVAPFKGLLMVPTIRGPSNEALPPSTTHTQDVLWCPTHWKPSLTWDGQHLAQSLIVWPMACKRKWVTKCEIKRSNLSKIVLENWVNTILDWHSSGPIDQTPGYGEIQYDWTRKLKNKGGKFGTSLNFYYQIYGFPAIKERSQKFILKLNGDDDNSNEADPRQ